jgi:hypothetical protein
VDINGKIVETTSGDIYSTFYIGQNLNKGTYYIKVKVGTTTKTYSVMKI